MCVEAVAVGRQTKAAAARVAARTRTGLHTDRLSTVRGKHPPQTLLELDLRLPAEDLLRAGDVRLAHLRVVHRQRLEDDLARRPRHLQHGLRKLEDRELARVAEVDRQVLAALREQHEPAYEVVDVAEAARLRAAAVDGE